MTSSALIDAAKRHETPLYVYDKAYLQKRASGLLSVCQANNCTLRYALKANPHPDIVNLFKNLGLHFDASSEFESQYLIKRGVAPSHISLSSQQPPIDTKAILKSGVQFVATSLHQLKLAAEAGWKGNVALRLNPGVGSGHNNRTTTGGVSASFGIWHEYLPQVLDIQKSAGFKINRLHFHIGSGADGAVWRKVIQTALSIVETLPSVEILDIGGGYKIARVAGEKETDMTSVLSVFSDELAKFHTKTGRNLRLEIEPGTWLVAGGGTLVSKIVDIVDTGKKGYTFLKLDTGLNDFMRPAIYGAQHSIEVLNNSKTYSKYVVVGHNCESGDILTPAPGDPERIEARRLKTAKIGDLVAIGGAGAYGASMRAIGYNHFPPAKELFI